MATRNVALSLALALAAAAVLLVSHRCAAQSSAGGSCMTEIVSLSPCMSYMSGNASSPAASCCSALKSVVSSNPRCLCMVLGGGAANLGISINDTRALELPGACKVQTPPASQCKSAGIPASSPPPATPSTTPASPATPSVPYVTPAGYGSKTTPAATGQFSGAGGMSNTAPASILLTAAIVLLYAF